MEGRLEPKQEAGLVKVLLSTERLGVNPSRVRHIPRAEAQSAGLFQGVRNLDVRGTSRKRSEEALENEGLRVSLHR
jgi:hypothetical protein